MLKSETLEGPLRVAILVHRNQVFDNWEISLFERLERHPSISLVAFVTCAPPPRPRAPSLAFRLLSALEKRLFRPNPGRGGAPTDESFRHIPRVSAETFDPARDRIDIVISHVPGLPSDNPFADLGDLWVYSFYSDCSGLPETFGFHECLNANPVTQCAVLCYRRDGSRSVIGTCTTNTKFNAAFNAAYAKAMLPALMEKELVRERNDKLLALGTTRPSAAEIPPGLRNPSLLEILRYVFVVTFRTGHRLINFLLARIGGQPDSWSLVVSRGDVLSSRLDRLIELPQQKGESRADPFLFQKDGKDFVFFEGWDEPQQPGRIRVGRLDGNEISDIVELDLGGTHLSYPYVFESDGNVFMVPETHQRNRVEVWRCTDFPGKWELHATALEGLSPADTVILEWDDQWWLFTNLCSTSILDHCMELHVYKVDGPDLKRVQPHPLNPVVLDTTRARNAGRPFVRDNRLVRPAQMTSHGIYGYGMRFMEITRLSMDAYSEREIRRIEPDRKQATTGCHHLDSCGDFFIMDVRRAYGSRLLGARPIALKAS